MIDYKETLKKLHLALPELTAENIIAIFDSIVVIDPHWKPEPKY